MEKTCQHVELENDIAALFFIFLEKNNIDFRYNLNVEAFDLHWIFKDNYCTFFCRGNYKKIW